MGKVTNNKQSFALVAGLAGLIAAPAVYGALAAVDVSGSAGVNGSNLGCVCPTPNQAPGQIGTDLNPGGGLPPASTPNLGVGTPDSSSTSTGTNMGTGSGSGVDTGTGTGAGPGSPGAAGMTGGSP